jgi:hypothetical protein
VKTEAHLHSVSEPLFYVLYLSGDDASYFSVIRWELQASYVGIQQMPGNSRSANEQLYITEGEGTTELENNCLRRHPEIYAI